MQGLDTNVLARFLLRDDPAQARTARAVVEAALATGEPLVVSLLVLLETEWVMRSRAGLKKQEVIGKFKELLEARDLAFENEDVVEDALHTFENGNAEFADCLMIAQYRHLGCTEMLTFDAKAAVMPGGKLLKS